MIPIKTEAEIRLMIKGGKRLSRVMKVALKAIKPGVSLSELNRLAESLIKKGGGKPSFKMVPGYRWATCINVNQGVVHGVPGEYGLRKGDLVSLDMGMFYQGLHTDMARTVSVGGGHQAFLRAGRMTLKKAIDEARPGRRIGHISKAIESELKKANLTPIRALVGHGVGKQLHEEPPVPCFLKGEVEKTPKLKPGMTLAIEVIYSQGDSAVVLAKDDWTVETKDGSLAGLFEDTVLMTRAKPKLLTVAS